MEAVMEEPVEKIKEEIKEEIQEEIQEEVAEDTAIKREPIIENELKNRKGSDDKPKLQRQEAKKKNLNTLQKQFLSLELLQKVAPYLSKISDAIDFIEPKIIFVWKQIQMLWALAQPYREFFPIVWGLVLVFFGGFFMVTFEAYEAFRATGYDKTIKHMKAIYEDFCVVRDANKKDDLLDEDHDGIADVKQISQQQLASRKIKLILKACHPDKVLSALGGLYIGFIAIIATLKIQFAEAITLGNQLGNILYKFAGKFLEPILYNVIPTEYQKWVKPILRITCKIVGTSWAWFLFRIIRAYYSAIRGAQIVINAYSAYCVQHGMSEKIAQGSVKYAILLAAISLPGFLFQISTSFYLPFPLNLLLFPVSMLESILTWLIVEDNIGLDALADVN